MKLILFDGECNLCNSMVQFVIEHDRKNIFQFASLQSNIGQEISNKINLQNNNWGTFVLYINDNEYYTKSSAAIGVLKSFGGIWKIIVIFKIIPPKIRDFVYDFVAKNRYKWFGKRESCMLPTDEIKAKFLS